MLLLNFKQCLLGLIMIISPLNSVMKSSNIDWETNIPTIQLKEITIKAHKIKKATEFLGFKLQTALDVNVSDELKEVLLSYKGPSVKITSLKRYGTKSRHCSGKAVDLEFSHDLILWLVSEEGTKWREDHKITFYIEDKPNSKKLLPYKKIKETKEFVFENTHATGAHIHLNL